eukprot:scaffold1580_cov116-Cylindrotheca_fusiformis.AAC.15
MDGQPGVNTLVCLFGLFQPKWYCALLIPCLGIVRTEIDLTSRDRPRACGARSKDSWSNHQFRTMALIFTSQGCLKNDNYEALQSLGFS